METNESDKKMSKAKSVNSGPPEKLKIEPVKRKSFNVTEAVRSLDLALGRLKKSKLVNGECMSASSTPNSPGRRGRADMFMDVCPSNFSRAGMDNSSVMSMNFSHYELARNLSSCNCNSDGALSSSTCNAVNPADNVVKDEHLERFFRSAEIWTQKYRNGGPSNLNLNTPNK